MKNVARKWIYEGSTTDVKTGSRPTNRKKSKLCIQKWEEGKEKYVFMHWIICYSAMQESAI